MHQLHFKIKKSLKLTNKNMKVRQLPSFLFRLSTLLKEGYTFADSIEMLLPYHVDDPYYWRSKIKEQLRSGEGAIDILQSFSIPKQFLIAIQISEESGKLAQSLESISHQLEFNDKMRKKMISLLSYPILLSIFLMSIFLAFRTYFLPNITQILTTRTNANGSTSLFISSIFLRLPDFLFISFISFIFLVITSYLYIKRQDVQTQLQIYQKFPVINYFYQLLITNQLAKSIGDLLIGGFSLQQALTILQNQQMNKTLAFLSKKIEEEVIFGESLSSAVFKLGWFSSKFDEFIKHGEKSGYLGRQLLIYSELLEEKLHSYMKRGVSIIQPLFFIIIALSIIAAYLSILLPMYEMIEII